MAAKGPTSNAKKSRRVLLLFSGPYKRPDGLASFLRQLGFDCDLIDNDTELGGGADHDILNDEFFEKLLDRVKRADYFAFIAAPPCSTFSISRFIHSPDSRGLGIEQGVRSEESEEARCMSHMYMDV